MMRARRSRSSMGNVTGTLKATSSKTCNQNCLGNFSTIRKTFYVGLDASGVNNGLFFIGDVPNNVSSASTRRLTLTIQRMLEITSWGGWSIIPENSRFQCKRMIVEANSR